MTDQVSLLVVDDSLQICSTLSGIFSNHGYEVIAVQSGLDAISAAKNRRFDLVTLDVEMPGMSGIEVLRILKAVDSDLAVIMISAQKAMQTAIQAIRQGAYDYISKPVEPEELLLIVQRALERRLLLQENRKLIQDLKTLNQNLEGQVQERTRDLEEANRKLKEMDELKMKFISIASHEFRTPLTTIRGYAGWLASGTRTTDQQEQAFSAIQRNVDKLAGIVSEITDIARLKEKRMLLRRENVELQKITGLLIHEMRPFLEVRRQTLETEIQNPLPHVNVDRHRIYQVLSNLVLNAVRYTPDGGSILVRADVQTEWKDFVHVTVQDSGIGIEANQLERIFEEFYEAAPAMHHHSGTIQFKSGGIGLGLSVVRGIINEHGGRIWAESPASENGRGSVFHLLLPRG